MWLCFPEYLNIFFAVFQPTTILYHLLLLNKTQLKINFKRIVNTRGHTLGGGGGREEGRKEERKKKKTKMTKLDFHRFQVRHFSNNFEQSPCYCKMGQRQRADLSV